MLVNHANQLYNRFSVLSNHSFHRHANRDVVLTHVRGHYHEAGLLIEDKNQTSSSSPLPQLNIPKTNEFNNNVYMNNILSMCLSPNAGKLLLQQQQQLQQQMQNGATPIPNMVSIPMVTPSVKTTTTTATGTVAPSSTNEHGETDEASSGGTSVVNGGWRGPAPYRCGHCHQVSNWKHVIQVFLLTPPFTKKNNNGEYNFPILLWFFIIKIMLVFYIFYFFFFVNCQFRSDAFHPS